MLSYSLKDGVELEGNQGYANLQQRCYHDEVTVAGVVFQDFEQYCGCNQSNRNEEQGYRWRIRLKDGDLTACRGVRYILWMIKGGVIAYGCIVAIPCDIAFLVRGRLGKVISVDGNIPVGRQNEQVRPIYAAKSC